MIRDEIRAIGSSRRDLRNFGLVVGTGLIVIGGFLLWRGSPPWGLLCGTGALLVLCGLAAPTLLKPLQKAWMTLAVVMGWFMTRVILSLLFYAVLTPTGIVGRLFGKKFLAPPPGDGKSYWIRREQGGGEPSRLEKQF